MLLKGWIYSWWSVIGTSTGRERRGAFIEWILKMAAGHSTAPEVVHLSKSALRFCLFEGLGLRHLCCRPVILNSSLQELEPPIEAAEAREIKEDDKLRKERFDTLLPKAEMEYQQSSKSFCEFWCEFYDNNIVNDLKEDDLDDHTRSVMEIGNK
ncbi:MAG: hypothetical protein Q9179_005258 [Wetmoreana sp. 5 TL-2023]